MPVESFAAVFRAADRNVRMSSVELVEPRTVHVSFAAVPSEVVVVGNHVRNLKVWVVHCAH